MMDNVVCVCVRACMRACSVCVCVCVCVCALFTELCHVRALGRTLAIVLLPQPHHCDVVNVTYVLLVGLQLPNIIANVSTM